jgi:tetratricopeptide (TPR) repeat protein
MVRIFGEVPYFPEELSTEEELNAYVLSNPASALLDIYAIVDTFSLQLENAIADEQVGVNYNSEGIDDATWSITSWNNWAYFSLMGQMYLHVENYPKAIEFFEKIIYDPNKDYFYLNLKQFDLVGNNEDHLAYLPFNTSYWSNMFKAMDQNEHMLSVWFNKERKQQNRLQYFLSNQGVNIYALAPSRKSVINWETQWHDATFVRDAVNPENMYMVELGEPGDFIRGHGASYAYMRGGVIMTDEELFHIMELKRNGLFSEAEDQMRGVDTVVYKYSIGRDPYDLDAHYSLFRAGPVHLYYAEALNAIGSFRDAEDILNRGISFGESSVSGVRRRAYLAYKVKINSDPPKNVEEGIEILDFMPVHDPYTNQIIGFRDYSGQQSAKEFLRDSLIIRERALESAWEGERFYDLIRIAEKWDDPSFLADKVAAKYPAAQREQIRALLMDKENWYLPYFKAQSK